MASSINASTAGVGGVITTADNTGILNLQSGGTTVATVSSTGLATTGITNSALTSGRVPFASTGGLLADSANLVWDNTNGYLGIGTASPVAKLSVDHAIALTGGGAAKPASLGYGMYLLNGIGTVVYSAASTAFYSGDTERMRLDSSGNLGLGVTPSTWESGRPTLEFGGSVQGTIAFNGNATNGGAIWSNSYYTSTQNFYKSNGAATLFTTGGGKFDWSVAPSGTANAALTWTTAMTLNNSGNLALQGATTSATGVGITFPATQSASSDANCLDDYEEGTCTITLSDSLGNNATMTAENTWRYIKIGRSVTVSGTLSWSSTSSLTAGSRIRLTGLPFEAVNVSNMRWCAMAGSSSSGAFNIVTAAIKFGLDANNTFIWGTNVTGNNVDNSMAKADMGTSGTLYGLTITYFSAS